MTPTARRWAERRAFRAFWELEDVSPAEAAQLLDDWKRAVWPDHKAPRR